MHSMLMIEVTPGNSPGELQIKVTIVLIQRFPQLIIVLIRIAGELIHSRARGERPNGGNEAIKELAKHSTN